MAHYAELDNDGTVLNVLVIDNDQEARDGEAGIEKWLQQHVSTNRWIKTSFNNSIRKRYAIIGGKYDNSRDAFINPKPYRSWILDEDTLEYEAPIKSPGRDHGWDEGTKKWKKIPGYNLPRDE